MNDGAKICDNHHHNQINNILNNNLTPKFPTRNAKKGLKNQSTDDIAHHFPEHASRHFWRIEYRQF
jgi:hypothetical protein